MDEELPDNPHGEPWQWPEQVWRPIVERVRAGRSLAPSSWPGGARCAVAISFDADHETIPLRDSDESPMRISQGQYGSRRGIPRIRDLLQREAIPATFFYPAVSALLHPDEVREFLDGGGCWDFQPYGGALAMTPCASPLRHSLGDGGATQQELF